MVASDICPRLPSCMVRCPQCHYDLVGTSGPCPECGAQVDRVALAFAMTSEAKQPGKLSRTGLLWWGTTFAALPLVFAVAPVLCYWYVNTVDPMGAGRWNHPGTVATTVVYIAWSLCGCLLFPLWSPIVSFVLLYDSRWSLSSRDVLRLAAMWIALVVLALAWWPLYNLWPYAEQAWTWWWD